MKTFVLVLCALLLGAAYSGPTIKVNEQEFRGDIIQINDGNGIKFKTFVDKFGQTHITADVDREFLAAEVATMQNQTPAVMKLIDQSQNLPEDWRPRPLSLVDTSGNPDCWVYSGNGESPVKGSRVLQYEGSNWIDSKPGVGSEYSQHIEVPKITSRCVQD